MLRDFINRTRFSYGKYNRAGLLPDKAFLRTQYFCETGGKLNLENPVLYNEKVQWSKLYDRRREWVDLVDKYEARKFIAKTATATRILLSMT